MASIEHITNISLPQAWETARQAAVAAGRGLDSASFGAIYQVFLELYASGEQTPGAWTPEYGKREFLLVLDEDGAPGGVGNRLLADAQAALFAHSQLGLWFQTAELDGQPVLLVARWLCHLVGLRHATVQIYIDPPAMPGFTLAQLRGLDKVDKPGALDLPCAGHVDGLDGVEASLQKELGEELNLGLEDLEDLCLVTRHTARISDPQALFLNEEFSYLYRARIKTAAVARIRFSDGEVAGLGLFSVAELRLLVQRFPERAARGLIDALPFYE